QEEDYASWLDQLAAEVGRLGAADKKADSASAKGAAEAELRLWDQELKYLTTLISGRLGDAQAQAFAQSQKDWLKARESAVTAELAGRAGGVVYTDSLEYTQTLARYTKDQVYALAKAYGLIEGAK
ncbi:MAG: lysozyme inhibitor LprI family protein, partial [Lachnospiraceae bacterium]|nr:lysozyme inhibitor LprI family protein [Lachnospiraceae bacterium]